MSRPEPRRVDAFWVAEEHRPHFARLGLVSAAQVLASSEGDCLRRLPDRENWRWALPRDRGPVAAYVKKHHARRSGWFSKMWNRPVDPPAGVGEARLVEELAAHGLTAMRLVAYGAEADASADRSFLITEDLAGYEPLDDFLRRRFADRATAGARREAAFDALLKKVADTAARFHQLGYNHRDFYACHFFVRARDDGGFDVSLIDLQRVERRQRWRRRWIVKDLAQLAHSAPRGEVSCADRLRFVRRYLGVDKLRPADRRLIRAVLAKQATI